MRKTAVIALVALVSFAATANAGSIRVGVFGGSSIPVVQDDQDNGSVYGLRAQAKLVPLFLLEPFFSSSALGDKTLSVAGINQTREGSDVTTWGLNAMLTMGGPVSFYPYAGIGSAKFKRTGQDESFTSYQFGLGLGITPAPKFGVDLRGELQAAVDGGSSRKMANVTLGVSYALFNTP